MKIFITPIASKKANKCKIDDDVLVSFAKKANGGLFDAELGANLFKLRVGRKGDYRTVLFLVKDQRCVLLELFPKSVKPTIKGDELDTLRDFAKIISNLNDDEFEKLAKLSGWKDLSDEPPEEVV